MKNTTDVALHVHQVVAICSSRKKQNSVPSNVLEDASVKQVLFGRKVANVLNPQNVAQAEMKSTPIAELLVLLDVILNQVPVLMFVLKVVSAKMVLFAEIIAPIVPVSIQNDAKQTIWLFLSNHSQPILIIYFMLSLFTPYQINPLHWLLKAKEDV